MGVTKPQSKKSPPSQFLDKARRLERAEVAFLQGDISSIRQAAYKYDVPFSSLQARLAGRRSAKDFRTNRQRLTKAEEASIVRAAYAAYNWGWGYHVTDITSLAISILRKRGDNRPLSPRWYQKFITRHPEVRFICSRRLELARFDAQDPDAFTKFFELFETTKQNEGVHDDDIYNMDEKGFMKGSDPNRKDRILVPSKEALEAIAAGVTDREWISVIETIGTSDIPVPPTIIFRGQVLPYSWTENLPSEVGKWLLLVTEKGWTNQDAALEWLKHFDKHTKMRVKGRKRLLVLDGHVSHQTVEFITYCADHNIIPLRMPPHTTNYLQPLDVGIFGPLATAFRKEMLAMVEFEGVKLNQNEFLRCLFKARKGLKGWLAGAWRGCGLLPFNPEHVLIKLPTYRRQLEKKGEGEGTTQGYSDLTQHASVAQQAEEALEALKTTETTPRRRQHLLTLQNITRNALADVNTLTIVNNNLIRQCQKKRQKKDKGFADGAKVLTVDKIVAHKKKKEERQAEEKRLVQEKKAVQAKKKAEKEALQVVKKQERMEARAKKALEKEAKATAQKEKKKEKQRVAEEKKKEVEAARYEKAVEKAVRG